MTGLAEKMKSAGYKTHFAGKWDAGMATPRHTPHGRGNLEISAAVFHGKMWLIVAIAMYYFRAECMYVYIYIYIRAKPLSRRRLKLPKTVGFIMISGNFQWKNGAKRHLTSCHLFFLSFTTSDIQCSFATLKASDGDSFTIPAKQSFL